MTSIKAKMIEIIQEQPEDATYEEIIRELAFEHVIDRGLVGSRAGRSIENAEMFTGSDHGPNKKALDLQRWLSIKKPCQGNLPLPRLFIIRLGSKLPLGYEWIFR